MEAAGTPRMQKLQQLLERQPNDPELLYAMGMEYKKLNDAANALAFFARVSQADPGYAYAHFQRGQVSESLGDVDAAKRAYQDGLQSADVRGDAHARSEIQAALDMIE